MINSQKDLTGVAWKKGIKPLNQMWALYNYETQIAKTGSITFHDIDNNPHILSKKEAEDVIEMLSEQLIADLAGEEIIN